MRPTLAKRSKPPTGRIPSASKWNPLDLTVAVAEPMPGAVTSRVAENLPKSVKPPSSAKLRLSLLPAYSLKPVSVSSFFTLLAVAPATSTELSSIWIFDCPIDTPPYQPVCACAADAANDSATAPNAFVSMTFMRPSCCSLPSLNRPFDRVGGPNVQRRALAPHPRRLDLQPLGPPREEELEVEVLGRAVGQHLRAHAREAGAQAPLLRAERLPFHAVRRVRGRVALADGLGEEALAPVLLVALRAREVHLAAASVVCGAARLEVRARRPVDADVDRQPARLARDVSGDRKQFLRLVRERLRALVPGAAGVDAALEVEQAPARGVELRIRRGDAAHALRGVLVAVGARASRGSRALAPHLRAALDPEHRRIAEVVGLQRAQVGAEEVGARLEPLERERALLRRRARAQRERDQRRGRARPHATTTGARSEPRTPSSSIHENSSTPLASATVKNWM